MNENKKLLKKLVGKKPKKKKPVVFLTDPNVNQLIAQSVLKTLRSKERIKNVKRKDLLKLLKIVSARLEASALKLQQS